MSGELIVPSSEETMALAQEYLLQAWYDLPTAVFPNGVPEELRNLPPWIPAWPETVLPNPEISKVEFTSLVKQLTQQPTFSLSSCGLTARMLNSTSLNPATGCWERHVSKDYGKVSSVNLGVANALAHRVFWQELVGNTVGTTLGPTDILDHRCLNKSCCYPRHIARTTYAGNNRSARLDRVRAGQAPLFLAIPQPLQSQ